MSDPHAQSQWGQSRFQGTVGAALDRELGPMALARAHRATGAGMVPETAGYRIQLRLLLLVGDTEILEDLRFRELPSDFARCHANFSSGAARRGLRPDTAGALLNYLYRHLPTSQALLRSSRRSRVRSG